MSGSGKTEPLLLGDIPAAPATSICSQIASVFCCFSSKKHCVDAPKPTRNTTIPSPEAKPLLSIAEQALASPTGSDSPSSTGSRSSTSPDYKVPLNPDVVRTLFAKRNASFRLLGPGK